MIIVAFGQLGTAKSSARTERKVVTAATGIVQSSVTGTGNLEPVTEEDVNFQTSGTLQHIDVTAGEHVHKGQLLATLDSSTAALTVAQAKATLAEARVTLRSDEKTLAKEDDTSDDTEDSDESAEDVDEDIADTTSTSTSATGTTTQTDPTTTTTRSTTDTETTTTGSSHSSGTSSTSTGSSATGSSSSSSSSSTVTASTVDSDKLAVVEDEQTVTEDQTDLVQTRLRAPVSGTITSLESITPGESVSSGSDSDGDSSASSDSGDSSDSSSSTSASTSSTSSSSAFAVIDTLHQLSMTVSFTEADISRLKVGQTATVTPDALSGVELAGTVTAVSSLGTTSDDVVSYDATITLDQYDSQVKPGMSASAVVIIRQGHGVTVPSAAVTGSGTLVTVTEIVNGKDVTKRVIIGLRGSSRDLVVAGLASGARLLETETLPSTGSSSASSSAQTTTSSAGASGGLGGTGGGGAPGGSGGPP